MESIEKTLEETIISLLSRSTNIATDQDGINDIEFRAMGLSSIDIIKIFIDLENAGFLKLSALGNSEPPRTVNEMIDLCNSIN
jgi:acyl carrier protein